VLKHTASHAEAIVFSCIWATRIARVKSGQFSRLDRSRPAGSLSAIRTAVRRRRGGGQRRPYAQQAQTNRFLVPLCIGGGGSHRADRGRRGRNVDGLAAVTAAAVERHQWPAEPR